MRTGCIQLGLIFVSRVSDMRAQKKDRDVLLAFKDDIGPAHALAKACEFDSE